MPKLNNTIEILKILDKSNCRECNESTCLAFAAAVFNGHKRLDECTHLEREVIEKYGGETRIRETGQQEMEEAVAQLKSKISHIDLQDTAKRLGGRFYDKRLIIKICGKDFNIDSKGNFSSEIHIHSWITGPLLSYILDGKGKDIAGQWLPFRELKGGRDWIRFFEHRCERPLKKVADEYTELFNDMLHIFNGKKVENHYESDISLVLYPLPKVPILFCYWKPDEGLESDLNIFFDSTAEDNLNIGSIYALTTGLVVMFEKISLRHGYK